ncbi:Uncharacterised protein [Fusobacterium necrogenes]|uniref:Uncharacterized protein n=1 Tax=Fusobacterium necrogenes TaxID=858 RepID=A0A377GVK1_9FUSO|nr:hypothetical protein [Fusobacterium necrogenes]STO30998.1 Uncharacterised protein [Fusobacterium necrogenes]
MLFYDEFLKKLNEEKFQVNEIEKFSPEIKKIIVGLGVSLPLIIIAIAQLYMAKIDGNVVRIAFALIFIFIGVKQLRTTFSYKIQIDTKNKKIKFMNVNIDLMKIESCTLKEEKVGKKLEVVLDIITFDKQQYIIPLYMNKKVRFVWLIKTVLVDAFKIKK